MRSAAVLIVGDEILTGEIRDVNGPFLLARLSAAGVRVERLAACPDREAEITAELLRLRALADAVVVAGGIGPTHDDVTRPAVAAALGLPLSPHPEAARRIRGFYGDGASAAELTMALAPQGARVVVGPRTGTFGFAVAGVYVFPGVPLLLEDLTEAILPEFCGAPLHRVELRTDRREGEIADALAAAQREDPQVAIGSYPLLADGGWSVRVVVRSEDAARAAACAARLAPALRA